MGYSGKVRAALLGLVVLATLTVSAVPASARASSYATVTSGATPLNVRSGPGTAFPRVRTLANRSRTTPACQRTGPTVAGPVRTTNLWDRLPGGGYVSDAYLRWRPSRPKLATCATPPSGGGSSGLPSLPAPVRPMSHAQFLATVAGPAQTSARWYAVPASVTLAQAILESGWGGSGLSTKDRNYFGIKCFSGVHGPIAVGCHAYATHECGGGRCWPTTAAFRVYRTITDSIVDHGRFLVVNSRYKPAFAFRNNPDQFAVQLQKAGYATSPTYARNLQHLMRLYNLYRYDIRIR